MSPPAQCPRCNWIMAEPNRCATCPHEPRPDAFGAGCLAGIGVLLAWAPTSLLMDVIGASELVSWIALGWPLWIAVIYVVVARIRIRRGARPFLAQEAEHLAAIDVCRRLVVRAEERIATIQAPFDIAVRHRALDWATITAAESESVHRVARLDPLRREWVVAQAERIRSAAASLPSWVTWPRTTADRLYRQTLEWNNGVPEWHSTLRALLELRIDLTLGAPRAEDVASLLALAELGAPAGDVEASLDRLAAYQALRG